VLLDDASAWTVVEDRLPTRPVHGAIESGIRLSIPAVSVS
jgi:hypothetical protein